MDATAARVLPLRLRFAATSVIVFLGRTGKADSVAEREDSDRGSLSGRSRTGEFERKPSSRSRGTEGSKPPRSAGESASPGDPRREGIRNGPLLPCSVHAGRPGPRQCCGTRRRGTPTSASRRTSCLLRPPVHSVIDRFECGAMLPLSEVRRRARNTRCRIDA